jgi:Arc/MetJ family transcription regulator
VEGTIMPTNLAIDDKLIEDARRIGKHRTKREAVNEALREYVQHRQQLKVLDLFHSVDIDPSYDYKKQRKRT